MMLQTIYIYIYRGDAENQQNRTSATPCCSQQKSGQTTMIELEACRRTESFETANGRNRGNNGTIHSPRAPAMEKSAMGLSENDHEAISLGYSMVFHIVNHILTMWYHILPISENKSTCWIESAPALERDHLRDHQTKHLQTEIGGLTIY